MASRGFPSMTALLGLLAVAGYQNRDKLAELLGGGATSQGGVGSSSQNALARGSGPAGLDGILGNLGGMLGGAGVGGLLGGGLSDLVERFQQNGHGQTAASWVGRGPNQPVAPQQLEQALGPDVLATLSQQTGLTGEELLSRLSRELPDAVDKYTPEGRLPSESEFTRS
jgi:uncharacterized protein YidB (DUF937 family)